ncbi:MAG: hypothetical protein JWO54_152 [Candidatus Saccharibacteria bacterium]|nr:hypothetical protein [Candidatus Saccharibacteria bacterium]MDB5180394.1 hypothetical protein [Candidatus Saccharibacteria bacterium]
MTEQNNMPTDATLLKPIDSEFALPPAPTLPFTSKASFSQYKTKIGTGRVILALIVSLFFWFKFGPVVWIVSVLGLAVVIGIFIYLATHRSVTVDQNGVRYKGMFGKTTSINFDEIETVKSFPFYMEAGFGILPRIIIAKKAGGYFVNLTGMFYTDESIFNLLSALRSKNVTLEFYEDTVDYSTIAKQFPQLVASYERNPIGLGVVLALVIVVVVAIITFNFM